MRHATGTSLVRIDSVLDAFPYVVTRDDRIVAAFARKVAAENWARDRSWADESRFAVVSAGKEVMAYQHGEEN
jgi:hypothetical protein